jgi:hypothetical protein
MSSFEKQESESLHSKFSKGIEEIKSLQLEVLLRCNEQIQMMKSKIQCLEDEIKMLKDSKPDYRSMYGKDTFENFDLALVGFLKSKFFTLASRCEHQYPLIINCGYSKNTQGCIWIEQEQFPEVKSSLSRYIIEKTGEYLNGTRFMLPSGPAKLDCLPFGGEVFICEFFDSYIRKTTLGKFSNPILEKYNINLNPPKLQLQSLENYKLAPQIAKELLLSLI